MVSNLLVIMPESRETVQAMETNLKELVAVLNRLERIRR
jgi:hypothetical protein